MIETANIEAFLEGGAEKTIIFTAHYDSKSQMLGFITRLFLAGFSFISSLFIALYSIYYQIRLKPILNAITIDKEIQIMKVNIIFLLLTLAVMVVLIILFFAGSGNKSPGAVDNAVGVAVLLNLARHFVENPPVNLNLRFIATAAEEEGLIGIVKYMEAMETKLDKKNTYFINMDGTGAKGELRIVDIYGIPPIRTSRYISNLILKTAGELEVPAKQEYSPAAAGYDSLPVAYRGFEAVTLAYCQFDRALYSIHSENDKLVNVEFNSLERTFNVCKKTVEKIDTILNADLFAII